MIDRPLIGPAMLGSLSMVGLFLLQFTQTGLLQATRGSALLNIFGLICAVFSIRAVFPRGHSALSALVLILHVLFILVGLIMTLPMLLPRGPEASLPLLIVAGSVVAAIVSVRSVWRVYPER